MKLSMDFMVQAGGVECGGMVEDVLKGAGGASVLLVRCYRRVA